MLAGRLWRDAQDQLPYGISVRDGDHPDALPKLFWATEIARRCKASVTVHLPPLRVDRLPLCKMNDLWSSLQTVVGGAGAVGDRFRGDYTAWCVCAGGDAILHCVAAALADVRMLCVFALLTDGIADDLAVLSRRDIVRRRGAPDCTLDQLLYAIARQET